MFCFFWSVARLTAKLSRVRTAFATRRVMDSVSLLPVLTCWLMAIRGWVSAGGSMSRTRVKIGVSGAIFKRLGRHPWTPRRTFINSRSLFAICLVNRTPSWIWMKKSGVFMLTWIVPGDSLGGMIGKKRFRRKITFQNHPRNTTRTYKKKRNTWRDF